MVKEKETERFVRSESDFSDTYRHRNILTETIAKSHSRSKCRGQLRVKHPSSIVKSTRHPIHLRLRGNCERWVGKIVRASRPGLQLQDSVFQ